MTRAMKSFSALAFGSVLIVAGLFGVERIGEMSFLLAGIGLLVLLVGGGVLLSTQSRAQLRVPHPAVYVLLALAVAFHVFQNLRMWSAGFSYGWFLWALMPYGLLLVLSCFEGTRLPVIASAALALLLDVWTFYEVARSTSSTAAITLIWIPLWNAIAVIPTATFLVWLVLRYRRVSSNAP